MANSKKKNVKNTKKIEYNNDNEVSKLIKLVIVVTLIVFVFYGITVLVNKKIEEEQPERPATIQYDEILIGNSLKQPNDDYYVMIYDNEDYDVNLYGVYLSIYSQKDEAIRVYTSQLNNPINQGFKAEMSNLDVTNINDLKIKSSTLLKISDGKIEESYEGEDLVEYLKEISKTDEAEE